MFSQGNQNRAISKNETALLSSTYLPSVRKIYWATRHIIATNEQTKKIYFTKTATLVFGKIITSTCSKLRNILYSKEKKHYTTIISRPNLNKLVYSLKYFHDCGLLISNRFPLLIMYVLQRIKKFHIDSYIQVCLKWFSLRFSLALYDMKILYDCNINYYI